ncbi:hypothetical protein [Umezawaea sp. Da 62-37]|uniref:hypothetical protein n=1 Tax=Umezawaea sp. Da 62-37 TaxID=3075927 RepID=UPI0028F74CFC|nr:hypothetical protein [Umezawaea sp. Da 62-37]WNV90430.1 hypothetical protein RM788_19740 [Umezawaea sp. Da 62-37]
MRWVRLVPEFTSVGAHFDRQVLSALDAAGVAADLVLTHVERTGSVAVTVVSARITGGLAPGTAIDPPVGGRCVRFPGWEAVTGTHPVSEIVAATAIDEVVGIGAAVTPWTSVATAGFVRPEYRDGRLVLLVEPAAGGVFQPAEVEEPHECCAGSH